MIKPFWLVSGNRMNWTGMWNFLGKKLRSRGVGGVWGWRGLGVGGGEGVKMVGVLKVLRSLKVLGSH